MAAAGMDCCWEELPPPVAAALVLVPVLKVAVLKLAAQELAVQELVQELVRAAVPASRKAFPARG